MNYMRRKTLKDRYSPMLTEGKPAEEIKAAILADKLEPTEEEAITVLTDIEAEAADDGENKIDVKKEETPAPVESAATPAKRAGDIIAYELFKVKPNIKKYNVGGKIVEAIDTYEKDGALLKISHIEKVHADILNEQTPNTGQYYFAPGEDSIPGTRYAS